MISYPLNKKQREWISNQFYLHADKDLIIEYDWNHKRTLAKFIKIYYNVVWVPNPNPYGSFKFDNEKQLTMLLLRLPS